MQLPDGLKLSRQQIHCLESASGCPRGKKGREWYKWANSTLLRASLPIIPVPEDFAAPQLAPKAAAGRPSNTSARFHGNSLAAAAAAATPSADQTPALLLQFAQPPVAASGAISSFVITGGTLFGNGFNITINGGTLNGFFMVAFCAHCCCRLLRSC